MVNTKLSAFLSLLLVFCSGIAVGAVGYHVYTSKKHLTPEEFRKQLVAEMTREVHLDDQQVALLKQIYEDTRAAFDEARTQENAKLRAEGQTIHEQQIEKIKNILRPDQIPLYDALRARHEAERKKERRKGEKGEIKKD
jgi:exopolysaccharide biosynthesis protein